MCWTVIISDRENGIGNVIDLAVHNIAQWLEIIR